MMVSFSSLIIPILHNCPILLSVAFLLSHAVMGGTRESMYAQDVPMEMKQFFYQGIVVSLAWLASIDHEYPIQLKVNLTQQT